MIPLLAQDYADAACGDKGGALVDVSAHTFVGGDQRRLRMRAVGYRLDQGDIVGPLSYQIARMQHLHRIE